MVDWDGLENRCACKRTVGSNPTLSAILPPCYAYLLEIDAVSGKRYAGLTSNLERRRVAYFEIYAVAPQGTCRVIKRRKNGFV